jgi:molybdate transport system permease protein
VRRPPTILTDLAGLLALYLIAPFAAGLAQIGIADWSSADLRGLASACAVSIASATLAAVLVALGGIPLGYLLARRPGRGMSLLGFIVQLPLALPPLASGVLLLFLLGYSSPLGRLTNGALTDTFTGITLAEASSLRHSSLLQRVPLSLASIRCWRMSQLRLDTRRGPSFCG